MQIPKNIMQETKRALSTSGSDAPLLPRSAVNYVEHLGHRARSEVHTYSSAMRDVSKRHLG